MAIGKTLRLGNNNSPWDLIVTLSTANCILHLIVLTDGSPNSGQVICDSNGCTCPQDPITEKYPDPSDPSCEKYYLCHMGNAFPKSCDIRQAFHPEKRVCLSRSRVPFTNCKTAVPCSKNGYVADPQDCTKYYMCFYLQSYHYGCKVHHYFDQAQVKCILNKKISENCSKKKVTTSTTPVPIISSSDSDENVAE